MRGHGPNPGWWLGLLVAALSLSLPAAAQVQLFSDLTLSSASGNLAAGYTGSFGNVQQSAHGLGWSAAGSMTGYYYKPDFLSFSVQPYYDQSRSNSDSQSLSNSSGFSFSSSIFGGTHFPGSLTYSKAYNSDGTFGVPGIADFTTHGNNDALGIGWSELKPDWPTLTAQFELSHAAYTIYGTNDEGTSRAMSLSLHSSYQVRGFNLNGGYSHSSNEGEIPLVFTQLGTSVSDGSSNSLNFGVSHSLPLHGSVTATFSRYSSNYAYSSNLTSGDNANDSFTATASIIPTPKLTTTASFSFDDNLGGVIVQQILQGGGTVQELGVIPGTHSLSLSGTLNYQARSDLSFGGQIQRRQQEWGNFNLGVTTYTGLARYMHAVGGGNLAVTGTMSASQEDSQPGMVMGMSGSLNYSRRFGAWDTSLGFAYAQNVQSLLITYLTSNYNFGGSVRRRIGKLYVNAAASLAKTGLTPQPGSGASSEDFSVGISTGKYLAVAGSYQNSSGQALQGVNGLIPNPVPNPLVPFLVVYSGKSYSFSASSTPVRRLAITGSYSRSMSDTLGVTTNSNNQLSQLSVNMHYQWRKMYFNGGYSQFTQGISLAGTPPSRLSTFYVGVSRWITFF